jgi:L-ribulose-5-phosphate 4-epimerase
MSKYKEIKRIAYDCNMQLPELGLVLFTFGNVSAADRDEGVFAIKPSGVPYIDLRPEDMVVVDFNAQVVEGKLNPSSDTKTHAVLYTHWMKITGIAHTHSTYATAWAQSQKDIPILGTTHADHLATDVPCTPVMSDEMIGGDYEYQTGLQIMQAITDRGLSYEETEMMVVAGHGPFTWGKTPAKAVYNSALLEEIAKMAYLTLHINPETPKLKESLIRKHYDRKHGIDAYYGQRKPKNL